ncbi:MAG: hypothetical protein QXK15_01990, partial [Candidatus Bathyarchaeia archaeon]
VDIDGKTPPNNYTVNLRIEWIQDEIYNLNDTLPININVTWRYSIVILAVIAMVIIIAVSLFILKRKRVIFKKPL